MVLCVTLYTYVSHNSLILNVNLAHISSTNNIKFTLYKYTVNGNTIFADAPFSLHASGAIVLNVFYFYPNLDK